MPLSVVSKEGAMRRLSLLLIAIVLVSSCGDSPTAPAVSTLISYPAVAVGSDNMDRAFYIPSYPGTSLSTVTLWFANEGSAGSYTFRLVARAATYDGTAIDSAQTTVALTANPADTTRTTFTF